MIIKLGSTQILPNPIPIFAPKTTTGTKSPEKSPEKKYFILYDIIA